MVLKALTGVGNEELLLASDDAFNIPASWSPDGRYLLFVRGQGPFSNNDVWVLPREGNGKPYPLLATPFNETRPKFSPDGRWIAYVSNEDGPNQLYVIPVTAPTATGAGEGRLPSARKVRVSTGGAISPQWRRDDGRELFYLDPSSNAIMAASVDGRGSEFSVHLPVATEQPVTRNASAPDITASVRT